MKPELKHALGIVLILTWSVLEVDSQSCNKFPFGHTCRNIDLTAFCLQISQMIKIRNGEKPVKPYPSLDKLFMQLAEPPIDAIKPFVHFGGYYRPPVKVCTATTDPKDSDTTCPLGEITGGPAVAPATTPPCGDENCFCCILPPPTEPWSGTIFSLQDGCELNYVKAPIFKWPTPAPKEPPANTKWDVVTGTEEFNFAINENAPPNPYKINITEIDVKNKRLHNWLHFQIVHDGTDSKMNTLGKPNAIKMAFIMVHDAAGYPVGEFMNRVPCGATCKCEPPKDQTNKKCHQGHDKDTLPCMFDSSRITSNTGMMIVHTEFEGLNEIHGTWRYSQSRFPENFVTELHFKALIVDDLSTYEMLGVYGNKPNARLSGMSERRARKVGVFGWNAVYKILHPTASTVGAWDHFPEDTYSHKDVDCHKGISDAHYTIEPYPTSGEKLYSMMNPDSQELKPSEPPDPDDLLNMPGDLKEKEHCYNLNYLPPPSSAPLPAKQIAEHCENLGPTVAGKSKFIYAVKCASAPVSRSAAYPHDAYGILTASKQPLYPVYPWTHFGGRTEAYTIREGAVSSSDWRAFEPEPKMMLYWGLLPKDENSMDYKECAGIKHKRYGTIHRYKYPLFRDNYDFLQTYGLDCPDADTGRRVLNLNTSTSTWPNVMAELWKFSPVSHISYQKDRCYCQELPPTPDPRYVAPPALQIQGRRQHAYQMIFAWNCVVPFGIFVSRYYKETYSKVFFLQEYWWYTIHVLCMASAGVFTFGGIYVVELKRQNPINWKDPNITVHIIMGYIIIATFFLQMFTGFFRVKEIKKRIVNIFTHWLLGVVEYLLGVACMINSGFILMAGMTCSGVVALVFLVVFQVLFYASMEVHMRNVDKQLKLKPPRSYLPPPIMRIFHKDAPDAKFRIYMLIAYGSLCIITSAVQYLAMASNSRGESCFLKSKEYYASLE